MCCFCRVKTAHNIILRLHCPAIIFHDAAYENQYQNQYSFPIYFPKREWNTIVPVKSANTIKVWT